MNKNNVPRAKIKPRRQRKQRRKLRLSRRATPPTLRFSPTAWAKLLFLRDYGETEVGGFAIASQDDLLLIEDVQLVNQVCSWAHVAFDDSSVADFFDQQVDAGRKPEQFGRIWLHTHPGDCPNPSMTDEETFERVFGRAEWALMFILARGGKTFARLRFNVGPGVSLNVRVRIDYTRPFDGCELAEWEQAYLANVQAQVPARKTLRSTEALFQSASDQGPFDAWPEHGLEATDQESQKGLFL